MKPYSMHPAYVHMAAIERKLAENTGMSVFEWVELTRSRGPEGRKERREWLVGQGLGSVQAMVVVDRLMGEMGPESYDPELLVAQQYPEKKAHLLPVYEHLLEMGFRLGDDVRACPCSTMVPLYRNHVFAQIKPTTLTRIDFGLALGDTPAKGLLIDTGGFAKKDRITHRIPIQTVNDITDEVQTWLKTAYDRDV